MRKRVLTRWWRARGEAGHRPRVLVEDDQPALAISDFSAFSRAGFDMAFCSGPGTDPSACPLLRGQDCDLLAGADAVLHGLDPGLGVCAAIRHRHPGTLVLAKQRYLPDGTAQPLPAGCVPLLFWCSVHGQIDALQRALDGRTG